MLSEKKDFPRRTINSIVKQLVYVNAKKDKISEIP